MGLWGRTAAGVLLVALLLAGAVCFTAANWWACPAAPPQVAAVPSAPSMEGIEFSAFSQAPDGCPVHLSAERASLRSQRYNGIIFDAFKEVVLSHVRVTSRSDDVSEAMDWTATPALAPLVGPLLVSFPADRITAAGLKLIIEDLEVHSVAPNGGGRLLLAADTVVKEALANDRLILRGKLTIGVRNGGYLRCRGEALWAVLDGTITLPDGCVDGRKHPRAVSLRRLDWGRPARLASSPANHLPHALGAATPAGLPGGNDLREIERCIRNKDHAAARNRIWQLLVLNPNALNQAGISPMMLLGIGPTLGQFNPSALLAK